MGRETHVAEAVVVNLKEPLQQLRPFGLTVGHEEGDESLTVGPPQLHVPLQLPQHSSFISPILQKDPENMMKVSDLGGAVTIHIQKVEKAAVLSVPAVFQWEFYELLNSSFLDLFVTGLCTELQQKPSRLQSVA